MSKPSADKKPNSNPFIEGYGDTQLIARIFYLFVTIVSVGLLTGSAIVFSIKNYFAATIFGISILPVLLCLYFIHQKKFELTAVLLTIVVISAITIVATNGLGIHQISILGYPAILIVASLVVRKRIMALLIFYNVLCVAWLVFGELSGLYTPDSYTQATVSDFFSVTTVLIFGSIMVRLVSESLFQRNRQLQEEKLAREEQEEQRIALIKELETKNKESEILRGSAAAIALSLDLDETVERILDQLQLVVPFDSASIQLLRGDELEIIGGRGFPEGKDAIGMRFILDENDAAYPIVKGDLPYIFYPNVQEVSDKFHESDHDHVLSWMAIPLYASGKLIGLFALDGFSVDKFTKSHAEFSLTFANSVAIALENARLFSEAERRLERLTILRHIDQTITNSLDLHVTLNILLGHILRHLEVDAAVVLLYQSELQTLKFVAGEGFRTQALKATNLRLGQGFAGQVALDRRILQISDLNHLQTGFLRSPDFRNEGFVAYLGVPLTAKGNIIGVLEIYHRHRLDPDSEWVEFLETLAGQAAIAIDNIKLFNELEMSNRDLVKAYDATIEGWAQALELRDMETEGHSRRVVDLTLELAREMGVEQKQLIHIRRGALLHDIGKMGVPDAILQKPGILNKAEWEVIREHPVFAYKWLAPIEFLKPALDIPYCHHERWDGSGYPRGLIKEEIPLSARIFSVVDVWDAMTSDRPYRKRLPKNEVAEYLKSQTGILFDEQVIKAFLSL